MLHERTAEFLQFYREGEEAACFEDAEELAEKIRFYLDHPDERERVRRNGHARCVAENSMDERARTIIARLQEKRWHRRQS
jgi:spore maturation protein CgeB